MMAPGLPERGFRVWGFAIKVEGRDMAFTSHSMGFLYVQVLPGRELIGLLRIGLPGMELHLVTPRLVAHGKRTCHYLRL